jgi:hypothetical protein
LDFLEAEKQMPLDYPLFCLHTMIAHVFRLKECQRFRHQKRRDDFSRFVETANLPLFAGQMNSASRFPPLTEFVDIVNCDLKKFALKENAQATAVFSQPLPKR